MQRILIIEDTPIVREPMARLLSSEGYAVTSAANGVEAIASLATNPVDLVLLDVLMPKMNGVAFLEAFRAEPRWSHVPVIAITGILDSTWLLRLRELNVCTVIQKGRFDVNSLLTEVHRYLPQAA
ncbi:MAG TPA: response regulator [Tepidisphaeraceae bacterium]|nr:response regulator [Tepidisphaeraceae bacterium]